MAAPRISVITVTFNAEKAIEKTIRSVAGQTYENLEYLIIDGASKDATMDIVERYRERIERCGRIVSEPDKGLYDAMNKGARLATGDWLLFLNADDEFVDEQVVADVAAFIQTHPEADVVYGDFEEVFEYGTYAIRPKKAFKGHRPQISHQATFVRSALLHRHPFDLKYRYAADFEQISHFYLEGRTFVHLQRAIARIEMRNGITFDNDIASTKELYAIIAARGVKIEPQKRRLIRHKKLVRAFKQRMPQAVSHPVLRLVARLYKPL